jgi:demethylmenaquinone methyltransferase/2-methoxy-6-polyprenyl-1,4-benzoquinol methylase
VQGKEHFTIEMNPTPGETDGARLLSCMEPLRRPILQTIIASLNLPEGSRGLDVGCGIGLQALLLAQAVGPNGHVTGLDFCAPLLEMARTLTYQADMANRVSYQLSSWSQIPFAEGTFDWVWSIDSAGYAPDEPTATLRELARVVRSEGRLILGYWSSQCLLPGYPALEARLNATPAGVAPFRRNAKPAEQYLRTLGWMRAAGLQNIRVQTFVQTVSAPLETEMRNALAELFAMRWGTAEQDVSPEDWQT